MIGRSAFVVAAAAYVGLQSVASLSAKPLYPFNSYRMFAKEWKDGTGLLEYRIEAKGRIYRPEELLGIPFFQANRIVHFVYSKPGGEAEKRRMCGLLLARGSVPELTVEVEGVRYRRGARSPHPIRAQRAFRKDLYRCKR